MLHFFGNCQTAFLSDTMARNGHDVQMNTLATPITAPQSDGHIPEELAAIIRDENIEDCLLDRSLPCQFQILDESADKPELAVFNLFHEATPLFSHKEDEYVFFIDPAAMERSARFDKWLRNNCQIIKVNPDTYLNRFVRMVEWFKARHPHVPTLILTRLSHFPMFGPHPYSYLECWDAIWRQAVPLLEEWAAGLSDCHVVNLDRIFGGIWTRESASIEAHCPFLRIRQPEETEDGRLTIRRDLEHIGPMWKMLSSTIEDFLEKGQVIYKEDERPHLEWVQRSFSPEVLDREAMTSLIQSGGNYQAARVVGSFFWHVKEDFSTFLASKGQNMPICHNTLHMVKNYAALKHNRALLPWVDAQQERIQDFTANGPAFQQRYMETLNGMREKLTK